MKTKIMYVVCLYSLISCRQSIADKTVAGDYELTLTANSGTKIYFSGTAESQRQAYLNIEDSGIQLVLKEKDQNTLLKSKQEHISFPCAVRILKNGNSFRFWVGNTTEWIRGPLGEWKDEIWSYISTNFQGTPDEHEKWKEETLKPCLEPYINEVYAENRQAVSTQSFIIKKREWLKQAAKTVLPHGEDGSFYEQQIIPGAILEYQGKYYMYFMAGMKGNEEGSSQRTIGLAVSTNLDDWIVYPQPVLTNEVAKYNNIYINGAAVTPDNKIAIMYSVQDFPHWRGFMLATADKPEGPFSLSNDNPVYRHPNAAHEFDLVDMEKEPVKYEGTSYRYLFFYAGYNPTNDKMKAGDKGYLLYSNDLIHWTERNDNPVFLPETKDNWDVAHVRPRSLTKIGEYWYLWYEGVNSWSPPRKAGALYCDVIGLARSKDLTHWEYHPRNPVFSGAGQDADICGYNWVGWPRMVIKDKKGYVFFCGTLENRIATSYRTIDIEKLTDWESDYK
ncbi:hypothetical protein FACS1894123_02100 [Bacteroidia bacterium]|nr:hypothetical protein FACS1894123_02100 [Bacteroidia bacterium]